MCCQFANNAGRGRHFHFFLLILEKESMEYWSKWKLPRRNKGLTWCRENVGPRCTCIKGTLTNWWSYVWLTHNGWYFSSPHWLLFAFFIRPPHSTCAPCLPICTNTFWCFLPPPASMLCVFRPHLIQSGLGHRVVFYAQPLLMHGELAENVGQSSLPVWELILQRVVMLLLQDAAREGLPDEVLHRLQIKRKAANPDNHCVAVTKPKNKRQKEVKQTVMKNECFGDDLRAETRLKSSHIFLQVWRNKSSFN